MSEATRKVSEATRKASEATRGPNDAIFFYNGATGGLGKYLGPTLERAGAAGIRLGARLENPETLREEVRAAFGSHSETKRAVFLQLASLVSVPGCEKEPERARRTNVDGVVASVGAFIDEVQTAGRRPEILYVSTGHLYAPKREGKIREEDPLAPRSVYARTKLEAEEALRALCEKKGTRLAIARVFGLVAPDQPANYVLPGLLRRAREKDLQGIPGLENERDYLDSRDVCRALFRLVESPRETTTDRVETINVCSGEALTIRRLLEIALVRIHGATEGARLAREATAGPSRPDDIASIVGDPSRLVERTGERPRQIPIEKTVFEAIERSSG